jgi:hypothetical protein
MRFAIKIKYFGDLISGLITMTRTKEEDHSMELLFVFVMAWLEQMTWAVAEPAE